MLDQKTVLGVGLLALSCIVLLEPAALWPALSLAAILTVYAVRKAMSTSCLTESEASELNHVIQKCAFQSNLLAMNAVVEAARDETPHRELFLHMERVARDTRSIVEQKISMNVARKLDAGAIDELAGLLEESNRSFSEGSIQFDPQMMQRNVSRIEHILDAA